MTLCYLERPILREVVSLCRYHEITSYGDGIAGKSKPKVAASNETTFPIRGKRTKTFSQHFQFNRTFPLSGCIRNAAELLVYSFDILHLKGKVLP